MTEIVVIGGWGSTPKQYDTLAGELQQKFGPDLAISGADFFSSIKNPQALADKIDGKRIITHSAGAYAVAPAIELGAAPTHLDMVAPPSYDQSALLVMKGLRYEMRQRRYRQPAPAQDYDPDAHQILRHPQTHFGKIPALTSFPTLRFAAVCQSKQIETRLALMDQDGLFHFDRYPISELELALNTGVQIRMINGKHTRFTEQPNQVLDELDAAMNLELETKLEVDAASSLALKLGRVAALSSLFMSARRAA